MSKVKIDVINATNHDITLHKHTILGSLQLVRSVTPVEVKLAENSGSQTKKSATVSQSQANITEKTVTNDNGSHSDDRFSPGIEMSGLTEHQRELATAMLKEECDSFARNEDDVGCIEDLELEISLANTEPVQKKLRFRSQTSLR